MIIIENENDIFNVEADYLVNPANSKGWMGGILGLFIKTKGISEAIHYKTKGKIEKETKKYCKQYKPSLGDAYITNAGDLKYKGIIHVITIKLPGGKSNIDVIKNCLDNIITLCQENNIKSCAIPGIGTGTGGASLKEVAKLFIDKLQDSNIKFHIIDKNNEFKEYIKEYLNKN